MRFRFDWIALGADWGRDRPLAGAVLAIAMAALAASIATLPRAHADDVTVPIALQIDLLGRVATYERSFASRPGVDAVVLIVTRRGNAESARAAGQIEAALRRAGTIGGRPVRSEVHAFTSAAAVRSAVQTSSAAIVYLTPGLGSEVAAISSALEGAPVLSVSAVTGDADRGIVLCFELVAARPKLVVNLLHARRQNVEFSSRFLRLARVIQ